MFLELDDITNNLNRRRCRQAITQHICLHPFSKKNSNRWCAIGPHDWTRPIAWWDVRVSYGSDTYIEMDKLVEQACLACGLKYEKYIPTVEVSCNNPQTRLSNNSRKTEPDVTRGISRVFASGRDHRRKLQTNREVSEENREESDLWTTN